ncbi:MAG: GHMP kinase [Halolamina sp.]
MTGLFAPAPPEGGGTSRGASFAMEDGVVVALDPAPETTVRVEGEPASFEPVERVLDALGVTASADVRPEVPLGHGFGASGAATLATALAANAAMDGDRDRRELLQAAHEAEMAAGTGQGDVFIQDRGGLLWTAGDEPRRVEPDAAVEYVSRGGIDTSEMLADEEAMAAARRSGSKHLSAIDAPLTMRSLAERSRAYLEETGFATPFVEETVGRVEAAGGAGSMALFGDAVFAVDVDGLLANRTRVSTTGARLIDE